MFESTLGEEDRVSGGDNPRGGDGGVWGRQTLEARGRGIYSSRNFNSVLAPIYIIFKGLLSYIVISFKSVLKTYRAHICPGT